MESEKTDLLQRIKNNRVEADYFFQKLAAAQKPEDWFIILLQNGFLDPKNNPKQPIVDGKVFIAERWNVCGYLENLSKKIEGNINSEIKQKYTEFINEFVRFEIEHIHNNIYTNSVFMVLISRLDDNEITANMKKFFEYSFEVAHSKRMLYIMIRGEIFETLIDDSAQNKVDLFKIVFEEITEFYSTDTSIRKGSDLFSVIDDYWLGRFVNEVGDKIAENLNVYALEYLEKLIRRILELNGGFFNPIQIPNLFISHKWNHYEESYQNLLVRLMCKMLAKAEANTVTRYINANVNSDYSILRRLAIYSLAYHLESTKALLFKLNNPLFYELWKPELFGLFKLNALKFTNEEINQIIKWIEEFDYKHWDADIEEDNVVKINAFRRKEWLSALLNSKDDRVNSLYNKYNEINNQNIAHPGEVIWMESNFESNPIDIAEVEIEKLQNFNDLTIKILAIENDQTVEAEYGYRTYSQHDKFLDIIKANTDLVLDNLDKMYKFSLSFNGAIFHFLSQNITQLDPNQFEKSLVLIKRVLDSNIQAKENNKSENSIEWANKSIIECLSAAKDSFDIISSAQYNRLYFAIIKQLEQNYCAADDRFHSYSIDYLNTPSGKIYDLIFRLLFSLLQKDPENEDGKNLIDLVLARENISENRMLFFGIGVYLTHFHKYLPKQFITLIDCIKESEYKTKWLVAGFIFYSSHKFINLTVLASLKKQCLFEKIDFLELFKDDNDDIGRQYLNTLVIAALADYELGYTFLSKMIIEKRSAVLKQIIFIFKVKAGELETFPSGIKTIRKFIDETYNTLKKTDFEMDIFPQLLNLIFVYDDLTKMGPLYQVLETEYLEIDTEVAEEVFENLILRDEKERDGVIQVLENLIQKLKNDYPLDANLVKKIIEKFLRFEDDKRMELCNMMIMKGYPEFRGLIR